MFGRFFKNKDENTSKSLPPGHRPSHIGGGGNGSGDAAGGAAPAEPMGGGFFNLQPTLVKGPPSAYGQPAAAANGAAPLPPSAAPGQGGFSRPTSAGAHHGVPSYGAPQVPHYGQPQPQPPTGGMDMFGGMSLKAPPAGGSSSSGAAAPSGYGGASLRPSPIKYGGYSGSQAPSHAAPPMPASSGSLFSGLDLVPGGAPAGAQAPAPPMSYSHDGGEITRPVIKKSSGSGGRSGSFNSATASPGGVDASAHRLSVGPGVGAATTASRVGGAKAVKKKKTKSFRPGFGRQLSDESIAALQRGDLNEDDVIQQHHNVDEQEKAPPRMATNATDLAHLLPPVRNGSVLAGLTVHDSASTSSGGSVLAGLTVHGGGSVGGAPSSPRSSQSADAGGLLAGLSVHGQSSEQPDASMLVVLPSKKKTPAPPAEPEKPAAPPTPEEKLMNTLRDFHASAVSFRNSALKQNEEENRILERKVQLAKQLTQYEIDLRTIEAQQQQACEVEDFEKADALNATINSVRHCITLSESDVRKVDSELTAFVKAKEKAFTNQLRSTRGTLKELEKFREDQDAERSVLRDELKKYEVEQSEHLQFEAERIDTELHHVSSNMDHLTSEKSEIEGTIEEQCKSEISLCEELLVEKAGVEAEIRELERQLRIKMEQMQTIESSISKAEKDINLVRSKYSRQLKRIADREDGLLKTKHEVEADAEHLKEKKKQFTASIQDYESRISAFGKRMAAVKKEMRAATLLAAVLEVQETRRDQAIVRKKQHTAELTALADSAAIAEQSFVMLRKQHEDLEKSLTLHHNAIASAESMIPKLEQEKKAAAAQRNFKEAARISKDIKALEKDQATAEEMVEVVEMELQDLKERIGKRETEYEEKKEELKVVEKQLELNTLHELWKEAKHLRKSLRKFEKLKSEGIAAADGVDFRASALLLVQAEYEGCMMEAEALEAKYEVTDPAQDDEEEEEDDDYDDEESMDEEEVERLTEVGGYNGAGDANAATGAGAGGALERRDSEFAMAVDSSPAALEELASKIVELEEKIEQATENEEYELAAKLDEKIDVLRRRQHSLHALSAAVSESNAPPARPESTHSHDDEDEDEDDGNAYEQQQDEEEEEEEDEGGNSPEELENELRLVLARIKMLEADIERATDNEDYETAAELEEEMQQMREEETAIAELLAESRAHTSENEQSIPVSSPPAAQEMTTATSSLFEGLGFKTVAPEDSTPEPVSSQATSSLFAGLQLGASPEDDAAPIEQAMQAVEEVAEAVSADSPASPTPEVQAPAVVSPKDVVSSPRRVSIGSGPNSPRRKSSLSMFAGLQVGAVSVSEEEAPRKSSLGSSSGETIATSTAMFEGLQLGASSSFTVQQEEEPSTSTSSASGMMFAGLQLGSSVESVESVAVVAADSAVSSSDSGSLFGGLMVASSEQVAEVVAEDEEEEEDEATSEDGVVVDAADATEPSSENMSSMFGGLSVKSSDMAAEKHEDATDAEVLTTTTSTPDATASSETDVAVAVEAMATSTSADDMFGGLLLASSAAPVTTTTGIPDDDDEKEEPAHE